MEIYMENRKSELFEKAQLLPLLPGVYIMKNRDGTVIYVGKSRALKNRVSQYFNPSSRHNIKTDKMVNNVFDFDYMVTSTEMDALTLENRLIKLHLPRYNILLKDSKTYPYIKVTINRDYPQISVTRKRTDDGAKYFGPYTGDAYSIVKTAQKIFGVQQCTKEFPRDIGRERPCLYKQIGQCMGPCTGKLDAAEYKETFKEIVTFLNGNYGEAKRKLTEKMNFAAENMMFEAAALYRDRIRGIERLWDKQKVVAAPTAEQDIIALYEGDLSSCISVYFVRSGCVVDSHNTVLSGNEIIDSDSVVSYISDMYSRRAYIPREILIGDMPCDCEELSEVLSGIAEKTVRVRRPIKGDGKALCDMVYENAKQHAAVYDAESEKDNKTLVKLASMLSLEVLPERIEAIDISNYGSENITAGIIVCENGRFKKSGYRTYKIRSVEGKPDDYASMSEAIRRRLAHADSDGLPDLLLLDGGKGHLSVISELLRDMGADIPVFGMVKDDFHKTRALVSLDGEISIARDKAVFSLIYKIQEEVHRYTLSRMTNAKRSTLKKSSLEAIDGIGPAKAKKILAHFKGLAPLKNAEIEDIIEVKGISLANAAAVRLHFHPDEAAEIAVTVANIQNKNQ